LFIPKGGYASDLSSSCFAQNIIITVEPLWSSVVIAFNLSKQFMEKGDWPSKAGTGKYVLLAFCAEKLLLEFRIKELEALQLRRHQDQDIDSRLEKRASMRAFRYWFTEQNTCNLRRRECNDHRRWLRQWKFVYFWTTTRKITGASFAGEALDLSPQNPPLQRESGIQE
jgi:hypothetical protein